MHHHSLIFHLRPSSELDLDGRMEGGKGRRRRKRKNKWVDQN
jgi:hypothetical protein